MNSSTLPVVVDFSPPPGTSNITKILKSLKPGESYVHDHSEFTTNFATWIATRRSRLGMNFKHSKDDGKGGTLPEKMYRIFVETQTPQ